MKPIEHFMLPPHFNELFKNEALSSIKLTRETVDKINELVNAYNHLVKNDLHWKQTIEGKVNAGVLYMKDNLINSIRELFELLQESGDLSAILQSVINNEYLTYIDRFKDLVLATVTPQLYGATGDGIKDDTLPLQLALDSGLPVVVPKGNYKITKPLLINEKTSKTLDFSQANIIYSGRDYAFKITNYNHATIKFDSVTADNGSCILIESISDDTYVQYVNIYFHKMSAKNYCFHGKITGGWVNEIRFYKGAVVNGAYGFYLENTATQETTAWKLNEIGFEGIDKGICFAGSTRYRDIEIINPRYGDTNFVIIDVREQLHNLMFRGSMPFYDSYVDVSGRGVIYNSSIYAPYYNSNHKCISFQKNWLSTGESYLVGYMSDKQVESLKDSKFASITTHENVTMSNKQCNFTDLLVVVNSLFTCNSNIGAWTTLFTLPEGARPSSNKTMYVHNTKSNTDIILYIAPDGKVNAEVGFDAGDTFIFNYVMIKNALY